MSIRTVDQEFALKDDIHSDHDLNADEWLQEFHDEQIGINKRRSYRIRWVQDAEADSVNVDCSHSDGCARRFLRERLQLESLNERR